MMRWIGNIFLWGMVAGAVATLDQWWFALPTTERMGSLAALFILSLMVVLKRDLRTWGSLISKRRGNEPLSESERKSIMEAIRKEQGFRSTLIMLSLLGAVVLTVACMLAPSVKNIQFLYLSFAGWFLFSYAIHLRIRLHLVCELLFEMRRKALDEEIKRSNEKPSLRLVK